MSRSLALPLVFNKYFEDAVNVPETADGRR